MKKEPVKTLADLGFIEQQYNCRHLRYYFNSVAIICIDTLAKEFMIYEQKTKEAFFINQELLRAIELQMKELKIWP